MADRVLEPGSPVGLAAALRSGNAMQNTSSTIDPWVLTLAQSISTLARSSAPVSNASRPGRSLARISMISRPGAPSNHRIRGGADGWWTGTAVGASPTAVPVHQPSAPPRILWFEGAPGRLIIEIRANDRPGLLALLTGALERAEVDIDWAKVTTRGSMVDDVFCIALPERSAASKATGEPGSSTRSAIEHHLLSVLDEPAAAAV